MGQFSITGHAQTPGFVVQFPSDSITFDELTPNDSIYLDIQPRGIPTSAENFRIKILGGTATRGQDYSASVEEIVFSTTFAPRLRIQDDGIQEPDETVEVMLTDAGPGIEFGPRTKTTVIIRNSPPTIRMGEGFGATLEERFGGGNYPFKIVRRGDRAPTTSVRLRVTGGRTNPGRLKAPAATADVVFLALDERVEFASGDSSRLVQFQVLDDGVVEGNEWIRFELIEPPHRIV